MRGANSSGPSGLRSTWLWERGRAEGCGQIEDRVNQARTLLDQGLAQHSMFVHWRGARDKIRLSAPPVGRACPQVQKLAAHYA